MQIEKIVLKPIFPQAMCFLLLLLICWQLVAGIGSLIYGASQSSPAPIEKNIEKVIAKKNESLKTKLFGDYVPDNLNENTIKRSSLNMEVLGVIFGNDEHGSQVIIRTGEDEESMYSVGDKLPGGVIIKRITPEGVIIQENGTLESLSLPKNELIFEAPAKPLIEDAN